MGFGEGDCIGKAGLVESGFRRRKRFPVFVAVWVIDHIPCLVCCGGALKVENGRSGAGGVIRGFLRPTLFQLGAKLPADSTKANDFSLNFFPDFPIQI
jgi:hypothetical protein